MGKNQTVPWWFGAMFVAAGTVIMAIAVDWIHVDPDSIHAPRWVLAACGAAFALGGAMTYASRLDERVNHFLAFILIGLFASIGTWIAFGPGEREFSGGASIGPVSVGESGGETSGRIAFGAGAVMLWLMEIWIGVRLLRTLRDAD